MYSTHNKGKSVLLKDLLAHWHDSYFRECLFWCDVLDGILNKYNNTLHRTINMKPIDVKDNTYIDSKKEVNDKDPKFKVGDHVRISKYKNIFARGYTPNWSEEVFIISKIKNTVPWTYVINDLNGEEITGTFYAKELQKTNQKEFRIEKVIQRKRGKLYVKWKGYNNSFYSWTVKKDLVWFYHMEMSKFYPEPFGGYIDITVDLSNYAT